MTKVNLSTIVSVGRNVGILVTKGNGCWNLRDITDMTKEAKVSCTRLSDVQYILFSHIQVKLMEYGT